MKPTVPRSFLNQLKMVDEGLEVVWNAPIQRYEIWYIDKRNGLKKVVWTAEDDEGKPMELDNRILGIMANKVDWEMLRFYPDPKEQYQVYRERKELRKKRNWSKLREERKEFFDRNRRRIKASDEAAMRGDWKFRMKKTAPKIYIHG